MREAMACCKETAALWQGRLTRCAEEEVGEVASSGDNIKVAGRDVRRGGLAMVRAGSEGAIRRGPAIAGVGGERRAPPDPDQGSQREEWGAWGGEWWLLRVVARVTGDKGKPRVG